MASLSMTSTAIATLIAVPRVRISSAQRAGCGFVSSPSVMPLRRECRRVVGVRRMASVPKAAKSTDLNDKVKKSIDEATEVCAEDATSGECVAAWDEVEELSAAAADKRISGKGDSNDPLEVFCKDNPETDECRVYED